MPNNNRADRRTCPLCGDPREEAFKPFCSRGCRDRDLLSWFGETYRVPAVEPPEGSLAGEQGEED
ncbi:DNA gyrase inhibitor YacG [Sphingopyxis sp. MWB1]|uniref:DNA gyrase inhibitor YacG n=1 Tax=Sphingopyxis sp. MWB1 TaxID=1537715 RepID=UPI00051A79FB|nr:DNA gyrase inhibitor YacG [Sphingopyxis sp. MWB1]